MPRAPRASAAPTLAAALLVAASPLAGCGPGNTIDASRSYAAAGDFDAALGVLDDALRKKPGDTPVLHERARLLTGRALFPDAYVSYARYRASGGGEDKKLVASLADKAVLAAVTDASPDVRLNAAVLLGTYHHPVLLKYLAKLLKDSEVSVRLAAAEAIGAVPDPGGVPILKPALDDDDARMRVAVGRALLDLGDLSGEGYLRTAASDADPKIAARAAEALATIGVKAGKKAVLAALSSKDAFTRARGVEALGVVAGGASAKLLRTAFADAEGTVRAAAIESALRRPDAKEFLADIRKGLGDADWLVRDAAAGAVGKLEDTSVTETLREMVAGDARIDVKFTAALSLNKLDDVLGFEYIHRMLKSAAAAERRLAVSALGKLREGTKVKTLIGMLEDPEPPVRAATALALEKLGARESADALAARLTDKAEDPDVKAAAVHALVKVLGDDATDRVLPALGDDSILVRAHGGSAVLVSKAPPVTDEPAAASPRSAD